jgi:hypothetical protein
MKITCPAETIRQMINRASRNPQWKLEVKWGFLEQSLGGVTMK